MGWMPVRQSLHYLVQGMRLTARRPWLFFQIIVLFSLPAVAAAVIAGTISPAAPWRGPVLFLLQSIATVVAPVVFMMAVSSAYRGDGAPAWRIMLRAIPWLPRYLWTNAHTSLVFWIPVGAMVVLHAWLSSTLPAGSWAEAFLELGWWVLVGLVAVFLHTRTLLAPFLAVHGDLPASLAAWESWQLSRKHLPLVVTTLVICSAPAALPVAAAMLSLLMGKVSLPMLRTEMVPQLTGAGLQLIRFTLVPAGYIMYRELWHQPDLPEKAASAAPPVVLRLVRLTAWWPGRPRRRALPGRLDGKDGR